MGTGIPAASTAATAASKRSSWRAVKGSSGSSATAQCVQTASSESARFRVDQLGQADEVSGRGADAVHAGVDLEVDGDGRGPPTRPSHRVARIRSGVYTVTATSAARTSARSAGRGSESSRIGAAMPARAQGGRLGHLGDGQRRSLPPRPRLGRPAPRRGRSRPPSPPRTPPRLRTRRAGWPRWPPPRRGRRPPTPAPSADHLGERLRGADSTRSDATSPDAGPSAPARAWSHAPAAAASSGATAPGRGGHR